MDNIVEGMEKHKEHAGVQENGCWALRFGARGVYILASYGTSPHRTPTIGFFFFTGRLHRRHRLCAGGRVPGSSFVFSFQRKASSECERDVRGDVRGDVSTT